MGSSGGGSSSGKQTTIVRYAPYVEKVHEVIVKLGSQYRETTIGASPFDEWPEIPFDVAFFGTGYILSDYPALYDMFGKFMAGLDVDILYSQIFEDTVNSTVVRNVIRAERALVDDDIETTVIPRFETGMRDTNSVLSSTFIIGKAVIEDAILKSMSKFSAQLRASLLPLVIQRWQGHLEWNKGVISTYSEIMKLLFVSKIAVDEQNLELKVKNLLWPFTILELEKGLLSVPSSATKTTVKGQAESSKAMGILSGAASGAAIGAQIGQGWGAAIGGVVGGIAGLFS